jgi:hypothetical protein
MVMCQLVTNIAIWAYTYTNKSNQGKEILEIMPTKSLMILASQIEL